LAGTCAKFKKYLQRLRNKTRADMCIPRVSTIYAGCFSHLSISRFGSRFTKNLISALWKWKKHFLWDEMKIGLYGVPLHPKGHTCVRYGLVPTNYAMLMAESSSFNLEVMQPRKW
jgi:hypothetical protein